MTKRDRDIGRLFQVEREGRRLVMEIDGEGRDITPEEETRLDGILTQMDELRAAIGYDKGFSSNYEGDALERWHSLDADIEADTRRSSKSVGASDHEGLVYRADGSMGGPVEVRGETKSNDGGPCEQRDYRSMFCSGNRSSLQSDGWDSMNEFLSVIAQHQHDPRLTRETRAHSGDDQSLGGFAVPTQFAAMMADASLENEVIRPRASVWPMNSSTRRVPAWDGYDHSGGTLFGGFSAAWTGEGGSISETTGKLRLIELHARGLKLFTKSSNELLSDGLGFQQQLLRALANGMSWFLDDAFLNGDGAGKPLGILNDPAIVQQAKEAGQAADTIVYQNLTKMFSRMHPALLNQAIWIANPTTIPALTMLSIAVGTGGSHVPVLTEQAGELRILTRPVVFTEKLPVLGDAGDILFCAPSQYAIGMRQEISIASSGDYAFNTDETAFRVVVRADGQGTWKSAITPKNGDSLSWVVKLQAR